MKIAFLNIYNGLVNRGAERSTYELVKRLAENHEVYLIQGGIGRESTNYKMVVIKPLCPTAQDSSCSILRKFYLDIWSLQILFFTLKSLPFLCKQKFDVVVPINGGLQILLCKILTLLQKTKLIAIGRAGIGRDDKWNLLMKPNIFVALTKVQQRWAKDFTKSVTIVHIPNGIDVKRFQPKGEKAEIKLKKPVVLCVGAFIPYKNIDLTIKAVSKMSFASLLVLGDGPLKDKISQLGNNLLGRERFLLSDADSFEMPKYYRTADVFTLASKTGEAFGNVYLEAMASNLPIVATDDESRREIIGQAGYFVDPKDIEKYSQMLEKALKTDFDEKPREQAKKYSWNEVVKKYETILISLS